MINTRQRAPKWKPVLQTAGAVILFALALNENIFREILACALLLPALFLTVAKMIRRAEEKYPKFAPFGTFTYFACTLVVILAFVRISGSMILQDRRFLSRRRFSRFGQHKKIALADGSSAGKAVNSTLSRGYGRL